MATCKVQQDKPIEPPKKYILTLNEEEAYTLLTLTGEVTGSMNSPRQHTSSVHRALNAAGLSVFDTKNPAYRLLKRNGNPEIGFNDFSSK